MSLPLLSGEVVPDNREELAELREEVERLEQENRKLRNDLIKARADSEASIAAITALRSNLGPLYRALRGVFGEINLVVPEDAPLPQYGTAGATNGRPVDDDAMRSLDKWEGVKQRLGGKDAELIDILLTCGPKTNTQLAPMLKMHYSNATKVTKRLSSLGFIVKQGDAWALKK